MTRAPISAALPTYGRGEVLLDTVRQLLAQSTPPAEILVIDQTRAHGSETARELQRMHDEGTIRWERVEHPSQPAALNIALRLATQPLVLMLDDDIRIGDDFVAAHVANFADPDIWAVAGQVLQPGEAPLQNWKHHPSNDPLADINFPFRASTRCLITNGMSGNLSVRCDRALAVGGFDENFGPPVSYRFDADFCKRLHRAGGRIVFDPGATIHHLRHSRGGTRSLGDHKTSASPVHGTGDYYFALRQVWSWRVFRYVARRPVREVCTRFHLRHPWWIPVKVVGELRALWKALALARQGPRHVQSMGIERT